MTAHALAAVLLAAGAGILASSQINRDTWAVAGAVVLLLAGFVVSCATVRTQVQPATRILIRTRLWLFGLFRSRTEYDGRSLASVTIEIVRAQTESSGLWSIYTVAILGPTLRGVIGQFRSKGTADGTPDDPQFARDQAHRLALKVARALHIPVDIVGPTSAPRDTFPGEFSAFPESELATMTGDEVLGCLRQLLAACDAPDQLPIEFDSLRKQKDSSWFIYRAFLRLGGADLVRDVLSKGALESHQVRWLREVWGIGRETALDESLRQLEQFGAPPRKRREEHEGGFDWSGLAR